MKIDEKVYIAIPTFYSLIPNMSLLYLLREYEEKKK